MITFPCAKINLGLNIVGVRPDGYHDIETVFYPIPLHDALEIHPMDDRFPSALPYDIKVTGNVPEGDENDNLVLKAYRQLATDFRLPRIHAHLFKQIPSQAGLGGGSSDAAFMITLLDTQFALNMSEADKHRHAARLGADCAFFINPIPSFATGIGDRLSPAGNLSDKLQGCHLALVKPPIAVSTKEAYAGTVARQPAISCLDITSQPLETWRDRLVNDFEKPVFDRYPVLGRIKERLYAQGALYAAMSGSGSTIYGIFKERPTHIDTLFRDCRTYMLAL